MHVLRLLRGVALPLLLAGCAVAPAPVGPGDATQRMSATDGARTALVRFDATPFPYHGVNPATGRPFMDVDAGGRLGHASGRNGTLWEDETYAEQRVLLSLPPGFDFHRRLAIVLFLHGNGATLERDVRDRQGVARQLAASGLNAVLVAPQFARDARDSSAGRFWEPGFVKRFLAEAGHRLAELSGAPDAEAAFAAAPVILVAYSGGYLPAAAALRYGDAQDRIGGIVLLDALYGEADTFAAWVERRSGARFVSLYGLSSRPGNQALARHLAAQGITVETALPAAIAPGSVTFVDAGSAVVHGDFVTAALQGDPLADVLSRLQGLPRRPGAGAVASEAE